MKSFLLLTIAVTTTLLAWGQEDKSKRPSPPAQAKETIASGTTVTIDYGQPSLKGRTVGKGIDPYIDQVWRTGANEATVFTVDKDVKIEGKNLPAGKYALFTIMHANDWTIIFNKTWNTWGTNYKMADDVLRVKVDEKKAKQFAERMTFTIAKDGKVSLTWGDLQVDFMVN